MNKTILAQSDDLQRQSMGTRGLSWRGFVKNVSYLPVMKERGVMDAQICDDNHDKDDLTVNAEMN